MGCQIGMRSLHLRQQGWLLVALAALGTAVGSTPLSEEACLEEGCTRLGDHTALMQGWIGPANRKTPGCRLEEANILTDWMVVNETTKAPEKKDTYHPGFKLNFTVGSDELSLELINVKGGLVQAFKLNGHSIVLNRPFPDQMDGSQFWPSPQSRASWGTAWPPPAQIDPVPSMASWLPRQDQTTVESYPYTAEIYRQTCMVKLTSLPATSCDVQVKKSFSILADRGAVVLDYELVNTNTTARWWAPWEITRVPPNGLTFYATADTPPRWADPSKKFMVKDGVGATWFQHNASAPAGGKLLANSSAGFLAHTDGKVLLVKCFEKISAKASAAPGEAQIELYNEGNYVEVEQQGAYQQIRAGSSLRWRVLWFLRRLPSGAKATVADAQLVGFARNLCSDQ
mmetsp:Transcript_78848/g.225867  ORF Transcript_78848/g.225867 Transcript_78848/m.225867 type:complete len:399 (-) Transcript_78848:240-1436(-)